MHEQAPAGPSLQEIVEDLQKPLPPIEEPDPKFAHALRQPPALYEAASKNWLEQGVPVLWCVVLLLIGWYLHAGFAVNGRQWAFASAIAERAATSAASLFAQPGVRAMHRVPLGERFQRSVMQPLRALSSKIPRTRMAKASTAPAAPAKPAVVARAPVAVKKRGGGSSRSAARIAKAPVGQNIPRKPVEREQQTVFERAQPAAAPVEAVFPPVLTNDQIVKYKIMREFTSWRDFLLAARSGSRIARTVLDDSPAHTAVQFTLTSDDFKRHLPMVRNLAMSPAWVAHIVRMLRQTEIFDETLVVISPHGQRHSVPLTATTGLLNTVLGYETTPAPVRSQLELRRWILVHTRADGAEQPSQLTTFRTRLAANAAGASLAAAGD